MHATARRCLHYAQRARLDGLPNTAGLLDEAAQVIAALAAENARLRREPRPPAERGESPPVCAGSQG